MNARMYSVTPGVESAWRTLLEHITEEADVPLTYVPYPAPQPLERLWQRPDIGAVLMCGYPIALNLAAVIPIAAPIPRASWAGGHAVYRSDLIVRKDAPYATLSDTFGLRAGWTVTHSQSGFNAFRHHLLPHRTPQRPTLYSKMAGDLVTARNILDAVREGRIDIGPLDSYWHLLIAHHDPAVMSEIRVLESTPLTPIPAFVAGADIPADAVARLRSSFLAVASRPWFRALSDVLLLEGFAEVTPQTYAMLLAWDRDAKAAGYELPA